MNLMCNFIKIFRKLIIKIVKVKYHNNIDNISLSLKKDPTELCSCKCHYGGAVSCPGCKKNHGIACSHCEK